MAIVPDLSGNAPFPVDVHIVGASMDTSGLATEAKQDEMITAIEGITFDLDTTGLATEATLLAIKNAAESTSPVEVYAAANGYEVCAASSTTTLGSTGAIGDKLVELIMVPQTVDAGSVTFADGGSSAIEVFNGGTASISTLHPFPVTINKESVAGAWSVTVGADMLVLAKGDFT